ncbi:DUF4442 domain-containing protein [Lacihabitans sp. LS3-19]|uniref:DUF4442 domain-containing protein n=1 Tax=Lacihabitans sp. LS3-19 TaxID=2487335 RepID=UPI0020CFBE5B|nr:DUF4442 domain-containing protein [Lacihabitans sp. LS3-19]MCP9766577.1 DUF4442 domain-containing protein [Lacihabitans sp. LS3-19]
MNKLSRQIHKLNAFPAFIRPWFTNFIIGRAVKLIGTCGIKFETLNPYEVAIFLENKIKVRNHIGQIHAVASSLLAETATGIVVGMSIPDDKIPLIKDMSVKFIKRSEGWQRAVAKLDDIQIDKLKNEPKGEFIVPVKVIDQTGEEVILAEMNWAWITKKK